MPKLLRLLGDSNKNSTEIRNTFRQPIIVKPNAKVALIGVNATLIDEVVNEKYIIDDANNQFKIGLSDDLLTATISSGDYTPQRLLYQTELAANLTGNDTSGTGLHHQFIYNENTATVKTYLSEDTNDPMFSSWKSFAKSNPYTATDTSVVFTGSTQLLDKAAIVPMVHSKFTATLVNAQTYNVQIYAQGGKAYPLGDRYGVAVVGGAYNYLTNTSTTAFSPAISAAANDQVIIELFNKSLKITVKDSTGTVKGTHSSINTIKNIYYNTGQPLRWAVFGNNGTNIATCSCTRLTNAPVTEKHALFDDFVQAGLKFQSAANVTNGQLSIYLGHPTAGNTLQEYAGNPAELQPTTQMRGIPEYPGILVTLDGLGPLQSYDGASSSKAPDNILYVLHDLSTVTGNQVELDIPAPFYLDINNANPININELRVRLLPAAGQESNPVLTFTGKPCITLLIQD
jgi:hypothetical protein